MFVQDVAGLTRTNMLSSYARTLHQDTQRLLVTLHKCPASKTKHRSLVERKTNSSHCAPPCCTFSRYILPSPGKSHKPSRKDNKWYVYSHLLFTTVLVRHDQLRIVIMNRQNWIESRNHLRTPKMNVSWTVGGNQLCMSSILVLTNASCVYETEYMYQFTRS